ncbi:MAG: TraB/GumN family protein [Proteobacteria bacterium]|nr:TraB/GumN family protein [Pseudomonadota bacterium]
MRRSTNRLLVWIAAALTATAQSSLFASANDGLNDLCSPTSVLYEIDHNNRPRLEKILDNASRVANGEAVLWQVEKAGTPVSFLFGTLHVISESLQEISPATRAAIDQSKIIAVESAETSRSAYANAMAQAAPLMVSMDRELQSILAEDEITVVEKAITNAGYAPQLTLALKPWVAIMFLADSPCQKVLQERGSKSMDALVVDRAAANGLPVVGLETMLEQYRSLATISRKVQVAWLKASVELYPRVDDVSLTMTELYRFRRLDAVWPLTQELAPGAGLDDSTLLSLRFELVGKRNLRMLESALPLFENGGAFVAIGAMHQTGPDGLVALLRQRGFTVTAIE